MGPSYGAHASVAAGGGGSGRAGRALGRCCAAGLLRCGPRVLLLGRALLHAGPRPKGRGEGGRPRRGGAALFSFFKQFLLFPFLLQNLN